MVNVGSTRRAVRWSREVEAAHARANQKSEDDANKSGLRTRESESVRSACEVCARLVRDVVAKEVAQRQQATRTVTRKRGRSVAAECDERSRQDRQRRRQTTTTDDERRWRVRVRESRDETRDERREARGGCGGGERQGKESVGGGGEGEGAEQEQPSERAKWLMLPWTIKDSPALVRHLAQRNSPTSRAASCTT